jgi:ABC-2 type transport system permease protein
VDLGSGRWLTGVAFLALTLGLTSLLFIFSLKTAERLYYTGWASIQVGARKKPSRPKPAAPAKTAPALTWFERVPPPVRAVFTKDLLVLRRDLRNMSQLITPIIIGVIYGLMLLRSGGEPPAGRGEAPAWFMQMLKSFMVYGNVGLSLFVSWSLLSRLALIGFSQEGKNYWLLKSAPVRSGQLLTAKFLVAYLPALVLGEAFMLIISLLQRASLSTLVFGAGVVALGNAGAVGISLAFGVRGANLVWEDPRRMGSGAAGCLSALASFCYMLVSLGLFFGPPLLLSGLGAPEIAGQAVGLAAGGVLSLACAVVPPRLVVKRVARIGEA